jgi:DNA-binding CsgD family transcriptional regulator
LNESAPEVSTIAVLIDALERIADGECVIDPTIVARLVTRPRLGQALAALSNREREVLGLMAEGHSNQGISKQLVLSGKIVESRVRQIFAKGAFARNPPGAPGCSPTASMCSVSLRDGVFKYEVQPALPVPGKLFFFGQPPKYKGVTVTATTSH